MPWSPRVGFWFSAFKFGGDGSELPETLWSAQFLSRDPLAAVTRSPYSYAGDNPSNATDPRGMIDTSYLSPDQVSQINTACSSWQRQSLCTQAAFCAEWTAGFGSQSGGSCSAIGQIVVDNYNILENALAHADGCGNVTLQNG